MLTSQRTEIVFDAASATSRGRRAYQEDALATDFPIGGDLALAVLADGMGGHAAGDVASKIAVTEVFSELKLQSGDLRAFADRAPALLRGAALAANDCIKGYARAHSEARGLGTTLLALVLISERLYWISVGDSPLYLYRDGTLRQLNEDHSMAPQINYLVSAGRLSPEEGANHPDRNALTSVLCGAGIERIDCPEAPFPLCPGDLVIAASDGLQFLPEDEIAARLGQLGSADSAGIARALLDALEERDDPGQDNVTFTVVRVVGSPQADRVAPPGTDERAPRAAIRPSRVLANFAAMMRSPR